MPGSGPRHAFGLGPRILKQTEHHHVTEDQPLTSKCPCEGPPNSLAKLWVAAQNLARNCHGSQTRCRFRHRHDLGVEDPGQRIGPSPVTWRAPERRRLRALPKPVTRGRAETGFGGRDGRRVGRSILHEKPHLMIGYMTARQGLYLFEQKTPPWPTAITRSPEHSSPGRRWCWNPARATPSRRSSTNDTFSSRLSRASHLDRRATSPALAQAAIRRPTS